MMSPQYPAPHYPEYLQHQAKSSGRRHTKEKKKRNSTTAGHSDDICYGPSTEIPNSVSISNTSLASKRIESDNDPIVTDLLQYSDEFYGELHGNYSTNPKYSTNDRQNRYQKNHRSKRKDRNLHYNTDQQTHNSFIPIVHESQNTINRHQSNFTNT